MEIKSHATQDNQSGFYPTPKELVYHGEAGLQFSIISTKKQQRDKQFRGRSHSLEIISHMMIQITYKNILFENNWIYHEDKNWQSIPFQGRLILAEEHRIQCVDCISFTKDSTKTLNHARGMNAGFPGTSPFKEARTVMPHGARLREKKKEDITFHSAGWTPLFFAAQSLAWGQPAHLPRHFARRLYRIPSTAVSRNSSRAIAD